MPLQLKEGRAYVIAEAGVNHDGSKEKALRLIDVAADAKADAVKFQMFQTEQVISKSAPLAEYQKRSSEGSQFDMVKKLELPPEDFAEFKIYAERKGLDFITTPFDVPSARYLADLRVTAMKVPSGEITNLPFLREIAQLHIFTVISTGMCDLDEIAEALAVFDAAKTSYSLLHCVSAYPAPINQINLRAMKTMEERFGVPVGYSDHTVGIDVSITAAKLGARIIEKHFTINKLDPGPDHAASLEPDELAEMMRILRDPEALKRAPMVEEALGTGEKQCQPCEMNTRDVARRSLVLTQDLKKGEALTANAIAILRPGTGLAPKFLAETRGRKTRHDLAAGTILTEDMLL